MIDSRTGPLIHLAEWLCRTVAQHDLDSHPLYVLPQSSLSGSLGQSCCPFGYTTLDLDLLLKAQIGNAWQGRGACIVVNDAAVYGEALPDSLTADFCGIALHELAHVLQRPRLFTDRPEPTEAEVQAQIRQLAAHVSDESPEEPSVPWARHDLPFIRAFLHLAHRAEQAGYPVCTAAFCAGPLYGLSSALTYRRALGDEPDRTADQPIREILRQPFPQECLPLFISDVGRWEREQRPEPQGDPA